MPATPANALPPPLPPTSAVRYPMRPARSAAPVYPRPPLAPLQVEELAALGSLPLRAKRLAEATGIGRHRSHRKGANIEFADYREYQPGDDLRRVDWRLYGRTDRLQLRESHEETPLRVQLLLDVSASMSYASRSGLLTKLDYGRAVLGALALLVRQQRDACGVGLLADELLRFSPPSGSPLRLRSVWGTLETPTLATPTALAHSLAQTAEVLPRACLVVVASDFYEEPEALASVWRRLRYDHHDVIALQLVDPAERDFPFTEPADFVDVETGARLQFDPVAAARRYREALATHQRALAEEIRACGFDYLPLGTDAAPLPALAAYLARRSGRG